MPLHAEIVAVLNERASQAAATRLVGQMGDAGQRAGDALSEGLTRNTSEVESSYRRMAAGAEDVADAERDLQGTRDRTAQAFAQIARRNEDLWERETRSIDEATSALRDYGSAAGRVGDSMAGGFRTAAGAAAGVGQDAAGEFASGFAGASALTRLGATAFAIPGVGIVAAAAAAGGLAASALIGEIEQGMASLATRDLFAVRTGSDYNSMQAQGRAAADAYANGWGMSQADNAATLQFGIQAGVVDRAGSSEELRRYIEQVQSTSAVTEEDPQSIARGLRGFTTTGLVGNYTEGMDLIVAATQNGLNLSNDLLDTIEEYGTKFRDVGLSGQDALGLINQMWEGGARNVDVAADGLKEFAISVTDNSQTTRDAFAAMGFNADDMNQRFLAGGTQAREAFGAVMTELQKLSEAERQQVGLALFKTKWEDMGRAVQAADLDTAAAQLGNVDGAARRASDALSEHASGWGALGREMDNTFTRMREWLADSSVGRFLTQGLPNAISDTLFFDPRFNPNPEQPAPGTAVTQNPLLTPYTPTPGTPAPPGWNIAPSNPGGMVGVNPLDIFAPTVPTGPAPPPGPERQAPVPMPEPGAAGGASGPRLPDAPAVPYDTALPFTPVGERTAATVGAESGFLDARHDLAEKRARLTQLEQAADATEEDRIKARNDVIQAVSDQQQAELRLNETYRSQAEKLTRATGKQINDLGEIGARIDDDFGISDGLAGIAENFTKLLANIAAAPLLGQLGAVSAMSPSQGGYGAVGIAAARGAFGQKYDGIDRSQSQLGPTAPVQTGIVGSGYTGGLSGGTPYAGVPLGSNMDVTSQPGLDLLRSMGLKGATYGSHTTDGAPTDREIDVTDPAGGYGGAGLTRLADFARQNPSLFEEFIYSDPTTGQKTGIRSGQLVGPGTDQPGYYAKNWGGHQDHAHIEPSKGGGLGFGDGPDDFAPVGTGGPGLAGAPQGIAGPRLGPMILGGPVGVPTGGVVGSNTVRVGGGDGLSGTGKGGVGASDGLMAMAGVAASGLDILAPGAGQAAQTGMKLANRAIQFGGQAVGIGVQGALDTLLPFGGSELASRNWLTRIVGGFAGAAPALPNMAGKSTQPTAESVMGPDPATAQQPQTVDGRTYNNTFEVGDKDEHGIAREVDYLQQQQYSAPGM